MHAERSVISNESRQIPKLPSSHTLAPSSQHLHASAQLSCKQGGTWAAPDMPRVEQGWGKEAQRRP